MSKLLGYDYEISYKPGRENSAADALSRVVFSPSCNALFMPKTSLWDNIKFEACTHPYMIRIGKIASEKPGDPYKWLNGLVCFKNRIVIPPNTAIVKQLLQKFHDSLYCGHSGVLRTYKRLAQQFYWPSMYKTIQEYVASCSVGQ